MRLCSLDEDLARQYAPGIRNMNPGIMGITSPSVPITTKKIPKERYIILTILLLEGITFILTFLKGLNTSTQEKFINISL